MIISNQKCPVFGGSINIVKLYHISILCYHTYMKKIPVKYKGDISWASVDDEDYKRLMRFKWHLDRGYPRRSLYLGGGRANAKVKHIRMHQDIISTTGDMHTDHIDRDKLNNQRSNLRVCTRSTNMANKPPYKNNKSGYKGVAINSNQKWQANIQVNNKSMYLGQYATKIEAAKAYNQAALKHFGYNTYLNPIDN